MTTIKDAPVVELLIGTEKFPISDGSGEPVTATINLILEKVPEPDLSEYATKEEIPIKVSQLENDVPYALKSDVEIEVEVENGAYIVDLNGDLHDPNTFTGTADDVTGIGLITDNGKWIVALDEWYSNSESTAWNGNTFSAWGGYNKTVTGCWAGTSGYLNDFDGEANTDAIIAQLKGTTDDYSYYYTGAPAAEYCRAYSKGCKGVGSWYLLATGELNEIVLNKDTINTILTKLGKNNLSKNDSTWSSSQYYGGNVWLYHWNTSWSFDTKSSSYGVRPVAKLELKKPLKERVSEIESSVSNKQDVISDLEEIRLGAALGKSSILSIPNNLSKFHNDAGFITGEDVKSIKKVTALPDNPDSNTLYIITS